MPDLSQERRHWSTGALVAGVDEAGRGCVAGPLIAAAVVLDPQTRRTGFWKSVNDSKTLTHSMRLKLAEHLKRHLRDWAYGEISARGIDRLGVDQANRRAMEMALQNLTAPASLVLVDWIRPWPLTLEGWDSATVQHRVPKGDAKHLSIAAASVLAKVRKDERMEALDRRFPGYGFASNRGYLTAAHRTALETLGPCAAHRMTFRPLAVHPAKPTRP